jgi:hypothetical protein
MRTGIRIILIFLVTLSITGCVATRKKKDKEKSAEIAIMSMDYNTVLNNIRDYNITTGGFTIKKGTIDLIDGTAVEGEYEFTAKLNSEGDFYASVKGPLGIEMIRILAVGNDVCGIIRLTRTVYVGKKDDLMRKYGFPEDFFTAIFGDMPDITYKDTDSIAGNKLILRETNDILERITTICLDEMKVCEEDVYSIKENKAVSLVFSNFAFSGDCKYPSDIDVKQKGDEFHMKLHIETLVTGYSEKIMFDVPPYKLESL